MKFIHCIRTQPVSLALVAGFRVAMMLRGIGLYYNPSLPRYRGPHFLA